MKLQRIPFGDVDWRLLDSFGDRTVFQTREWLEFVAERQRATPVVAEVRDGLSRIGVFTGLACTRFGVRILGSPARGWTTAYMGFNLPPYVERRDLLPALERFAFDDLRCLHFELLDRRLTVEDGAAAGLSHESFGGYESDLQQPEDTLLSTLHRSCRWSIRKAAKSGVVIEEARDAGFADDYLAHLREVFLKQRLAPTYTAEHVRCLIRHLVPTGRLLLLRARDANGACIATGIFPATEDRAFFWGNGSLRRFQSLRPNEALHWYAMRYWRARGVRVFVWLGAGREEDSYKAKYGGHPTTVPWFFKSRYRTLSHLRSHARRLIRLRQAARGYLRSLHTRVDGTLEAAEEG